MATYITFGMLQHELDSSRCKTGKRLQFQEAVDRILARGEGLSEPSPFPFQGPDCGRLDTDEFNRCLDAVCFPVSAGSSQESDVNEEAVIPEIRDVFVIRHSRSTRPSLHRHDYFELDYAAEGSCTLHLQGEKISLQTGQMCVIAPGLTHDIEITDDSTVYCLMLRRSTFEVCFFSQLSRDDALSLFFRTMLFAKGSPCHLLLSTGETERMRYLLQNAVGECFRNDSYSNNGTICWVNLLLDCMLRSYSEDTQAGNPAAGNDFSRVLLYIRSSYQTITLDALAEHFHYSRQHLCALIRKNTGTSFTDLVRRIRLTRACDYLAGTSISVGEIARLVGYNSADHFSRVFREAKGMSPQEYRRTSLEESAPLIPFETS